MNNFIYKIIGYRTNDLLNDSAVKIQKTYRNYKDYQIKKRLDVINNLIPEKDNNNDFEEITYWLSMRKFIKYDKQNYIYII